MRTPDVEGQPIVGDVIAGKYRIENIAGEGGMGIVYEAEHVILRQRVAVKALLPGTVTSAETLERFSLEASAIARIASEHVVRVMDAGSLPNGAPYLVMEYLDGCDLEDLLASRGRLPSSEVVDFALQALDALAHAHAARVIHRDLKPANLFLANRHDGQRVIKLVDFGISKAFDASVVEGDRVVGSPAYMSPEQLDNRAIDVRTDLWSLGVVMYELIAGSPPFTGAFAELVHAIRRVDPIPLVQAAPGIAPELSEIVARCLRKDAAERWSSTAELARALLPHGSGKWRSALERIERALSNTKPVRTPRRFESLENALSALEASWNRDHGVETLAPPDEVVVRSRSKLTSEEAFGATLPAPPSDAHVVISMPKPETPASSAGRSALRILLIDDSELVLGLHAQLLTTHGFDVRTTTSVGELEALLDSWKPHLVLMDVQMPAISGEELCRRVKARFKATLPVVLVSDLPAETLAEHAKAAGADAFFAKTSDWASFVEFVRNILAITYSPEDLP